MINRRKLRNALNGSHGVGLRGAFVFQGWDGDRKLCDLYIPNGIVHASIENMFDTYFNNGTPPSAWYLGIIDNASFSAVDNSSDTMASHSGWIENVDYDEATRPAWGPDAAASQTIANSTKAVVTFNAAVNVKGFFLTSNSTKSGTSGTLWCTAILPTIQSMQPGQTGKLFYSVLGQEG